MDEVKTLEVEWVRQRNLRLAQELLDEDLRKRILEDSPEIERSVRLLAEALRENVERLRHNQGLEPIEVDLYLSEEKEAFGKTLIGRRRFCVQGAQRWDHEGKRVLHIRFFPE